MLIGQTAELYINLKLAFELTNVGATGPDSDLEQFNKVNGTLSTSSRTAAAEWTIEVLGHEQKTLSFHPL